MHDQYDEGLSLRQSLDDTVYGNYRLASPLSIQRMRSLQVIPLSWPLVAEATTSWHGSATSGPEMATGICGLAWLSLA